MEVAVNSVIQDLSKAKQNKVVPGCGQQQRDQATANEPTAVESSANRASANRPPVAKKQHKKKQQQQHSQVAVIPPVQTKNTAQNYGEGNILDMFCEIYP